MTILPILCCSGSKRWKWGSLFCSITSESLSHEQETSGFCISHLISYLPAWIWFPSLKYFVQLDNDGSGGAVSNPLLEKVFKGFNAEKGGTLAITSLFLEIWKLSKLKFSFFEFWPYLFALWFHFDFGSFGSGQYILSAQQMKLYPRDSLWRSTFSPIFLSLNSCCCDILFRNNTFFNNIFLMLAHRLGLIIPHGQE